MRMRPWGKTNSPAGEYTENVTIPAGNNKLHLRGAGERAPRVIPAGGSASKEAPAGVPIDVVFDVLASDFTFEPMSIEHSGARRPNAISACSFDRPQHA